MAIRIQLRRDTAANWVSSNPVLRQGEIGIETDTLQMKLGNGTSTWTQITAYMNLVPDGNLTIGDYVMVNDIGASLGVVGLDNNKNALITGSSIILEGGTDNSFETTLTVAEPTADRTITFKNADGTVAFVADIPTTTDALTEGSTNKYFSAELAQDAAADALAAGTHTNITVTYNDAANSISLAAAPGYVDEQAVDAVAAALAAGTHTNITVGYNDAGNAISLTGAVTYTDENAQDAIGNAVGTGLSYNDTTGAISVDTTAIQAKVANVTDTEIGYLDGVTSAIQTQLDAKSTNSKTETLTNKTLTSPVINTPTGITKSDVGLANVDNTTDANKPVSTATQTAIDLKAPIASPTFTGTVTLPGLPTLDLHAATKLYVDNVAAGINFHEAVHAASTINSGVIYNNGTNGVGATLTADTNRAISLLDGESVVVGQRILMKNQTDAKQNGIYTLTNAGSSSAPWVLTRAIDADNNPSGEMKSGDFVFVQNGAVNGSIGFINNSTANPIVIGTDNISYVEFNAGKGVTAGNGLSETTPGTLSINTGITADLNTAQTLTNKTINANDNTITVTSSNVSDFNEAAQDAIGTILSSDLAYNDSTPGIALNYVTVGNTLLNGVSGSSYGLIGTSVYLDVKDTNGYNKEIELDIAAVKTQLNTDGYITTSSTSTLTNKTLALPVINNVRLGYTSIATAAGTTTLTVDSNAQYRFTGTASQNVALPLVSTLVLGQSFYIDNNSSGIINVNSSGGNLVASIPGGAAVSVTCVSLTGTTASSWRATFQAFSSVTGTGSNVLANSPTFSGTVAGITSTMVGLGNVDNTTDANKPISTATQTALDLKVDESLFDAKGDLLVASADNTPAKLSVGTNGYLLTANSSAANGVEWAAAPVSLPSQTGNSGKYLTTDGSSATWGTLVVPITTGTVTVNQNTAQDVDTTALSAFTSIEYMVSIKQGSKTRTSKVILQTDGTSVDMTEFAITETGGTLAGVVVSATTASSNGKLQVTVTDALSTNATVKFSKVAL